MVRKIINYSVNVVKKSGANYDIVIIKKYSNGTIDKRVESKYGKYHADVYANATRKVIKKTKARHASKT